MKSRHFSRGSVCVLLALSGPAWAVWGCSGNTAGDDASQAPSANSGHLRLALTSTAPSGALYRLRQASLQVIQQDGFGFAFLSTENDPFSTTLEATLDTGEYAIDLFPGWFLEKVENGVATPVVARLLSSSTQFFSIQANAESFVSYRFETNGEVLEFGQGRLIVEIEVEETGPATLGEPLQIVDGFVSRDSNAHGIQAALFAAAAPVGATIAVGSDTGSVCVSGNIEPVLNEDFSTQWGSVFGLTFVSDVGDPEPWDRDAGTVRGFSFSVTGPEIPPIRFAAQPAGGEPGVDIFCQNFQPLSGDQVSMPFDSLTFQCWAPGGAALPAGNLDNIGWTVLSDTFSSHAYDFCIGDVRPIL